MLSCIQLLYIQKKNRVNLQISVYAAFKHSS